MTIIIPSAELEVDFRPRGRDSVVCQLLHSPGAMIGAGWIVLITILSLIAPLLPLANPLAQSLTEAGQLPSGDHLLGTDKIGRDVLSRLIYAAAGAIGGVLLCVLTAAVIGVILGLFAGYYRGWFDKVASLISDILQTLPGIIVMLLAVAIFGTDLAVGMVTLGLLLSAGFFRLVRSGVSAVRNELYVDAARVSGISDLPILFRHILPNIQRPVIVQASLTATLALLLQAGLSYLGQGPPPPSPQWGAMVREASDTIYQYPWLMIPSGAVIIFTALAFNAVGDALLETAAIRRKPSRAKKMRTPLSGEFDATKMPSPLSDPSALLEVRNLSVATIDGQELVHGTSFAVSPGSTLGLVGESGSGKTLTALSLLDLLSNGLRVSGGSIRFDGVELTTMDRRDRLALRGKRIGLISQEPMVALDPSSTVGALLIAPLRRHRGFDKVQARAEALALLALVGIKDQKRVLKSYPHELSGGMAQRVAIAIALSGEPDLLIADEPTTALDVTVQAEILDLLRSLQSRLGMALVLVTHDFGVVADICDEIVVMKEGLIVEAAGARKLFQSPENDYTRQLLAATPESWPVRTPLDGQAPPQPLLEIDGLSVTFMRGRTPFQALSGVSLTVKSGETVGLVGESGSGKTTLGRAVLGLVPASGGSIRFAGEDITKVSRARRRQLSSEIQAVFQDPYSSLDPRMAVGDILTEPMLGHQGMTARTAKTRVRDLLDRVKLPADAYSKHPSEFSGGQRQRIAIARALAMSPRLIVCDEALSALDLSTQRTVVELLEEIQQDTGVAYLFIAHDLSVVRNISDRVAVMYHGEIVETGDAEVIGDRPTHPYTKRLLLAAPVPDPARQEQRRIARTAQQTKILERNAQ